MKTNTIIQTDIRKYKYEYKYYQKQNLNIYMFMDIKAIKVSQLIHICTIIYNLWCQTYNNKK